MWIVSDTSSKVKRNFYKKTISISWKFSMTVQVSGELYSDFTVDEDLFFGVENNNS